jgi:transposase-like protein
MKTETEAPATLLEAVAYFSNADNAFAFMVAMRWPTGVTCPRCGTGDPSFYTSRRIWRCQGCKRQFSVKVGTLFEDSPIGLDKWLPCAWMLINCKNGISSYEVGRDLGVTQKTGWFMLHRLRLAMQTKNFGKIGGEVEIDETYIGGRSRFMHKDRRKRVIHGTGGMGKVAVMGLLERHGPDKHSTVRLSIVPNIRKHGLHTKIRENVEAGSSVYTDALGSYNELSDEYIHGVIDHSEAYVRGKVHTNGLENFWSLLKRAIKGTYVSVEPFHLFRYLDEQAMRFNTRKNSDAGRFVALCRGLFGKRLTYKALTGGELSGSPA